MEGKGASERAREGGKEGRREGGKEGRREGGADGEEERTKVVKGSSTCRASAQHIMVQLCPGLS
eukprot:2698636-Rhodomonas_salina.1